MTHEFLAEIVAKCDAGIQKSTRPVQVLKEIKEMCENVELGPENVPPNPPAPETVEERNEVD